MAKLGDIVHGYRFTVEADGDSIGISKVGFRTFYPNQYSFGMRARLTLERAFSRGRDKFLSAVRHRETFGEVVIQPSDRAEGAPIPWAKITVREAVALSYEIIGLDAMNNDVLTEALILEADLWTIGK